MLDFLIIEDDKFLVVDNVIELINFENVASVSMLCYTDDSFTINHLLDLSFNLEWQHANESFVHV